MQWSRDMTAQLDLPYQSHSWTSQAAAESISPKRTEQDRRDILRYIRLNYGATDEELQLALHMNGNRERPRRVELVDKFKLVRDSGRTRLTSSGRAATIWESAT
jgi:hypothetical protein